MGQPVVYAICAMVCYGLSDFIYKQAASAGIRADHFLMAQGWFFCPLVILYALATHTLVLDPVALWGSLAGVFIFIGFHYFIRSLITGSVSTNASIFRMNFIVTVILVVILLGEPLTASKIAGLALSLLAAWLLLGAGDNAERTPNDAGRRSLVQVVIATLAFGTSNFFHTVGLRHGAVPETLAVAQACSCRSRLSLSVSPTVRCALRRLHLDTVPLPRLCCSAQLFFCYAGWRMAKRACWYLSRKWVSLSLHCSGFLSFASELQSERLSASFLHWLPWRCW
jgi:uncharacterized membrane protein